MSKKKLLIQKVFERVKENSERDTKTGWAGELADYLDEHLGFIISKRTLIRYYEAYIEGNEDIDIELVILNKLSQYLNYRDYNDFISTVEKRGESACSTIVTVDNSEISPMNGTRQGVSVIIHNNNSNNNDNQQHFNVPDFIKKNGLGILEMTFVLLLVTGGVVFPNTKKNLQGSKNSSALSFFGNSGQERKYMYWNGERYIATDSSYISPVYKVIAVNENDLAHFRKITRKDTMTVENSLGKVWCSKWNNEVDFFTMDGINPDNGKELKLASEHMISKYSGNHIDSLELEE